MDCEQEQASGCVAADARLEKVRSPPSIPPQQIVKCIFIKLNSLLTQGRQPRIIKIRNMKIASTSNEGGYDGMTRTLGGGVSGQWSGLWAGTLDNNISILYAIHIHLNI